MMKKPHPWRRCPAGQHWVRDHSRSNTPHGVHGYCRHNPHEKDELQELEIDDIAERYFGKLKGAPCSRPLGFSQGSKFDDLIRGWTKYWNEVLSPEEPLDPNLVKAIIATESGFRTRIVIPAGKRIGKARGLMQITDESWKILKDQRGELRDRHGETGATCHLDRSGCALQSLLKGLHQESRSQENEGVSRSV